MIPEPLWWLIPSFFVVAVLYASVGHGGASGYLALLSLAPTGFAPDRMATTALTLNVLVAGTALVVFARRGYLSGQPWWLFAAASVPAAFLGGMADVSTRLYAVLLAGSLVVAALRLAFVPRGDADGDGVQPARPVVALPVGGAIGWVSGVTGTGGGILLSPLLILRRWALPQQAAAISAGFIVVNSVAALSGRMVRGALQYGTLWPLLAAAAVGGLVGARLGARHCSARALKRLLAIVLLVAAAKLALVVA